MDKKEIEKLYSEKIGQLNEHNKFYFEHDKPTISDADYYELKKKILKLEEKYIYLRDKRSPSKNIGYKNPSDPSGESIVDAIEYKFSLGDEIELQCKNYEETFRIKKNWVEGLTIGIFSKEIIYHIGKYLIII